MLTLTFNPRHQPGTPPERTPAQAVIETIRHARQRRHATHLSPEVLDLAELIQAQLPHDPDVVGAVRAFLLGLRAGGTIRLR